MLLITHIFLPLAFIILQVWEVLGF
uniref:Uncharacterized protein n=1 Tax=Anguilla anguilla TaxID=7936 RepID=A0A0E9UYL3_ANGAN